MNGNTSFQPANPLRSVLLKNPMLPSRYRMFVLTSARPGSVGLPLPSTLDTPSPLVSMKVRVYRLARHWLTGNSFEVVLPSTWTVPTRPSRMMSFHWSNTVSWNVPTGMFVKVALPLGSHFSSAKWGPSAGPTET